MARESIERILFTVHVGYTNIILHCLINDFVETFKNIKRSF